MAIWEDINLDFFIGFLLVKGHNVIVVVAYNLSKYCHLGSLPSSYLATTVVEFFLHNIIKLHGVPKLMAFDRDNVLLSQFWKEIFTKSGTTL